MLFFHVHINIVITILKKLGHKIEEFPLDSLDGSKGHSRVIIKLDDDKYDIHGIFESDPTWASKSAEDPDYFDDYSFLLRSPSFFRTYNRFSGIINSLESTKAINGFVKEYRQDYGFENYFNWLKDFKSLIVTIPKLCGEEPLISMPVGRIERPTRREFYDRVKGYFEMFSKDPDVPHLMSAINAVREVEHSENSEIKTGREAMDAIFDRYDSRDKDYPLAMKEVFSEGSARNNS